MERNINMVLAINVHFLREEQGLSQDDLEALSGVSKTKISWIENNQYKKTVDSLYIQQIANALHVTSDVLTETNEELRSSISLLSNEIHKLPYSCEFKSKVDSLYQSAQKRGPFERSQAYILKGLFAYYEGHYGSAYRLYQEAYELAIKSQDHDLIEKSRRNLASASMMLGMYEQAEGLVLQTLKNTDDLGKKARDLFKLGTLHYVKGNFERARVWYNEAIGLLGNSRSFEDIRAKCLQALGTTSHYLRDYEKALDFTHQSLLIAKECGDLMTCIYAYKTLGEIYNECSHKSESIEAYKSGIGIAEKIGRAAEKCMLEFEIASIENSYDDMIGIMESANCTEIPPHEKTKMYETIAERAFQLGYIEDVRKYYRLANGLLKK